MRESFAVFDVDFLWLFVDGKVNAVVFGTGTGGTLAGVGTYMKEKNKDVQVFLADPQVYFFLFSVFFCKNTLHI